MTGHGVFTARFHGVCGECGGRIVPGDDARWLDNAGNYAHAYQCPDDPNEAADSAALRSPRCVRCGTNHPGEC